MLRKTISSIARPILPFEKYGERRLSLRASAARALGRGRHAEGGVQRPLPHLYRHRDRRLLSRHRPALPGRLCRALRQRYLPEEGERRVPRLGALRGRAVRALPDGEARPREHDLPLRDLARGARPAGDAPHRRRARLRQRRRGHAEARAAARGHARARARLRAHRAAGRIAMANELLYWEDLRAAGRVEIGTHTFTAEDIIAFARQFDPQPFHVDAEAAKKSFFGGLIASGWHTCCMAMRLMVDKYVNRSASLGSPGLDNIRWLAPVRAGDTITHYRNTIAARASESKPEIGLLQSRWEAGNQRGETVMTMEGWGMFRRKNPGAPA